MCLVPWALSLSLVLIFCASAGNAFAGMVRPWSGTSFATTRTMSVGRTSWPPSTRPYVVRTRATAQEDDNNVVTMMKQPPAVPAVANYSDKQIWRAQDVQVNIVNKYVLLNNFTIETTSSSSNQATQTPPPLRVARLYAHWDTFWYTERSFDLELDNIELYMEFAKGSFAKGSLKQNNWNELNDPDFYEWVSADVEDENELVHFSSIRMTAI